MKEFVVALILLLCLTLQCSCAVSPTNCDATEPLAGKVLDLVNKGRQDGYLFQLLRVADAHLDKAESTTVYYLVLDVKESDCSVLSRKPWTDCKPVVSRRPSEIVIGQCKVIAKTQSSDYQDLRVKDFNCTTSSVSSALTNTKDSTVLLDFFEDTDLYREQADKALEKYKQENADFAHFRVDQVERVARARGGERTNYYVDFSVRNCSGHYFPRYFNAFGFCKADLSYNEGASNLESPKDIVINCDVFQPEEHRKTNVKYPFWIRISSNGHKHPSPGQPPFKVNGSRDHHHSHKLHKPKCPSSEEDKSDSGRPRFQEGDLPSGSRCHHTHFSTDGTHGHVRNDSSSEHHPHGQGHHGQGHHGQGHHGHGHHGHSTHGHGHHGHSTHGHGTHGHGDHGHGAHRHSHHGRHHHGRRPHHRPHGHDFHDLGPCDPPPQIPGHRDPGGPPLPRHPEERSPDNYPPPQIPGHRDPGGPPLPRHPEERSPDNYPPPQIPGHRDPGGPPLPRHPEERSTDKAHYPFERKQIGYVYQLPPLKNDEVLPLPEANFPTFSMPNHNSRKPEIQPFPQSASESCPGKSKSEFLQVSKFFANTFPKKG
ncbi:PREDICTED: histidine-rich glycoprotein [Condylura cristata]|uniref:histidine-rich glycoprotein n=1 Tax=Condylura cristata TaxID=143302 RepID=UPI000643798A|nr:PREDICTED: histidine-rich glycoprotein [Condylura cristata]